MLNKLSRLELPQTIHPYPNIPVGLVVISPKLQLLYMNRQARRLTRLLEGDDGNSSSLTKAFHEVTGKVLEKLKEAPAGLRIPQLLEIKRTIIVESVQVLFRGIGIPDGNHSDCSRILIRFCIRKD